MEQQSPAIQNSAGVETGKEVKDSEKSFCKSTLSAKKENIVLLLSRAGDLVTKDMEKDVLNAFFFVTFCW